MTAIELIMNKRFCLFCKFECGIEPNEMIDFSSSQLFQLMEKWYKCTNFDFSPRGSVCDELRNQIKEGVIRWY